MRRRTKIVGLVLAGALSVIGCSGDDGAGAGSDTTAAPRTEVPDPCALIEPGAVSELTGGDPGPGTARGLAPERRRVCVFESGLSLAVEVGENYEATIDLIRASPSGATIEDVDDVGSAAIWQDFGDGVGQLVAQGDTYFVAVTVPDGGLEVGQALAGALLDAL